MRGSQVQGRFTVGFENKSIDEGIVDELRSPVGTEVQWWVWDEAHRIAAPTDVYDDTYNVSSQEAGKGRIWKEPFQMPVVMAQNIRGTNVLNERGFYTTNTLRLVVAVADILRLLPGMMDDPNMHIKDRCVFQNGVYVPTRVLPRGLYKNSYAIATIDMNQVNEEELVNDSQFQQYAK